MRSTVNQARVLVHLATGIGNIVLATPLLLALREHYSDVDLLLHADYPGAAQLFRGWSALCNVFDGREGERPAGVYDIVVPAIPPYAWPRFAALYRGQRGAVERPPDATFYHDERRFYLAFAERLGIAPNASLDSFLPVAPTSHSLTETLVIAPGCKTGEMARKRWPYFPALAEQFSDVVVVGTADDLWNSDGTPMLFPSHVRSLVDQLSLLELAGTLAASGAVVANDSGIGHMAAAVGAPTVLLFGPTSHRALGRLPVNATVMRSGLPCEPCWFANRFGACDGRMTCLRRLSVAEVAAAVRSTLHMASFNA